MALMLKVPISKIGNDQTTILTTKLRDKSRVMREEIPIPMGNSGEDLFTAEEYADCKINGLKCEGGMFYSILTEAKTAKEVPVSYPDREDAEGNILTYAQYFRQDTQYNLGNGTWLFRICRTGEILTNADRVTYEADLGILLVKAEGVALMPGPIKG